MKAKKSVVSARKHTKIAKKIHSYNFLGLCSATLFFALSLLPSLLPRPWLFQGLISGFSVAVGYGLGVLVSFTMRWMLQTKLPKKQSVASKSWRTLKFVSPLVIIISLLLGVGWQNEVRELVSRQPMSYWAIIPIFAVTLLVAIGTLGFARLLRRLNNRINKKLRTYVPPRVSFVVSIVAVVAVFMWVTTGVFANFMVSQANKIYSIKNDSIPPDVTQPISQLRSGSSSSFVSWDTIGYQGRAFVGKGPSIQQIKDYTGTNDVVEPIRLYVGLKSATSASIRAQMAVAELKRTGAFDRKVLVIANTTGTGWLEPQTVDALEYMYGGNSAIIAQQYSYLPSWISFLVDKENATNTGAALFDAVRSEWAKLPVDKRPKLITYGLSLGSFSGNAAFAGVNDLRLSVDGALFVGTPSDTRLWQTITAGRDAGTPQWRPTYKQGTAVRFASDAQTVNEKQETWQVPRVLYLQHASDPVVWFDFKLLTTKPDWLGETRGDDVSPRIQWYPFVTFAQVAVDQFFGTAVPNGHGHNYPNVIVDAWAAVASPQDWTPAKAQKLQAIIDAY